MSKPQQGGAVLVKWLHQEKAPAVFIVVPKGVIQRAVDRNLLKRRIRAIMAPYIRQSSRAYKVMVQNPQTLSLPFADLKKEIKKQLLP